MKSSFKSGGALNDEGGAINLINFLLVTIENVIFEDLKSLKGGAIYIGNSGKASITNSRFTRCSANSGGAIYT